MADPTVHVIGAGLAGLSAAVRLLGQKHKIVIHELARHAGGRCRSYFEPALGMTIDNGNHLLLSANRDALSFLAATGASHLLPIPEDAEFPFFDFKTGMRWTLRPNRGRLPWWIFSSKRRIPGTASGDYLALARLLSAKPGAVVTDVVAPGSAVYDRLWHPILLSALNTELNAASASLAGAIVRETLAKGGAACKPLIATGGLGPVFIDPALAHLKSNGVEIRFDHQLRNIEMTDGKVESLDFGDDKITLSPDDRVVVAVPAWVAKLLVPEIDAPDEARAIINLHYKMAAPPGVPRMIGLVGGTSEWLFSFPGRMSVTISAGDRFVSADREPLAEHVWAEICRVTGLREPMPAWQIVKERRATIAATPAQNKKRPPARTKWRNLVLAGDWTATGLPATIEGAIRSGMTAANAIRATA